MFESQALANLLHRYAEHIDKGELQALSKLMCDCTIFDPYGNVMATGQDQIFKMYSGLIKIYPDDNTPHTHHLVSNLIVDKADASQATTRASYSVFQKMQNGNIETIICGQYKNLFTKIDADWQFKEHHMLPRLIGNMSEHLLIQIV